MRKLIRIIAIIIVVYLLLSIVASLAVAAFPGWAFDIVTHRAPLLIVEIPTVTIIGYHLDSDNVLYGMTDDGFYIMYRGSYQVGDIVTSVFIYNPFSNYCDDAIARWDVASWR